MKKYIEIGRDYLRKEYNGDLKAAVAARDGIIFDSVEKVQRALDYFNQDGDEKRAEKRRVCDIHGKEIEYKIFAI